MIHVGRPPARARKFTAWILILCLTLTSVDPSGGLLAQPVTVPTLANPAVPTSDLDPDFAQAQSFTAMDDWERFVANSKLTLAAEWELQAEAQIQAEVLNVTIADSFNSVDEYRAYLRAELLSQKNQQFAAWEAEADARIDAQRMQFLAGLSQQQADASLPEKDLTIRDGDDQTEAAEQLSEADSESEVRVDDISADVSELREKWTYDFIQQANQGLSEFAAALAALENNYEGTLAELDAQDAAFQQNLAAIRQMEQNVRDAVSNTVDQMEAFLNSSGLFDNGSGGLNANGTALQTLINDMRTGLNDGDPLATLSQQMLTYMQARRTEAQSEVSYWNSQINSSGIPFYNVAMSGPGWINSPEAVMMWEFYSAGNTNGLENYIRTQNGYGSHIDITIHGGDARGYTVNYPAPVAAFPGGLRGAGNVWTSHNANINFPTNGSYLNRIQSAFYYHYDPLCGGASYTCANPTLEQYLEFWISWSAVDNNAVANRNTWQGYVNDLAPVIDEWENTLIPALNNWEAQVTAYETTYANWQTTSQQLRDEAKQSRDTRVAAIRAERDSWRAGVNNAFARGNRLWDLIEARLTDKKGSLQLAKLVAANAFNGIDKPKSRDLLTGARDTYSEAFGLRGETQTSLTRDDTLYRTLQAATSTLNGLQNYAYAATLNDEAQDLRQVAIDEVVRLLSTDFENTERQTITYNPYEELPVLLRPEGWETAEAEREETDEEMAARNRDEVLRNYEINVHDDGSVTARRLIQSGEALFAGGDATSADAYQATETEQVLEFGPPDALRLVETGDLFTQWNYRELEEERYNNLNAWQENLNNRLQTIQEQMVAADEDRSNRAKLHQQSAQEQATFWSNVKSIATSMMGGADFATALSGIVQGQVASAIERFTGIPVSFLTPLLGGASIEQALTSHAESVMWGNIQTALNIPADAMGLLQTWFNSERAKAQERAAKRDAQKLSHEDLFVASLGGPMTVLRTVAANQVAYSSNTMVSSVGRVMTAGMNPT